MCTSKGEEIPEICSGTGPRYEPALLFSLYRFAGLRLPQEYAQGRHLHLSERTKAQRKIAAFYECNPLAFIAEQANGKASCDGTADRICSSERTRVPYFIGS